MPAPANHNWPGHASWHGEVLTLSKTNSTCALAMAYALANKPPRLACVLGRGLSHGQTSVVMPSQHANADFLDSLGAVLSGENFAVIGAWKMR